MNRTEKAVTSFVKAYIRFDRCLKMCKNLFYNPFTATIIKIFKTNFLSKNFY